jgi:hypothetical protein
MPRTKIFKELVFKKKYKSYHEFHYENKEKIYKSIVELFSEFQIVRNKTLSITISAKIENIDWTTELLFNKNEVDILKKDLMGYFEDIEDYETCSTIISLSNNLTK